MTRGVWIRAQLQVRFRVELRYTVEPPTEYGPSAARSVQKRPRANIPQYGPEQVKLVSSLLYGIVFYAQQHFRLFIQVNFWHGVREFPAYDNASSKNPVELK